MNQPVVILEYGSVIIFTIPLHPTGEGDGPLQAAPQADAGCVADADEPRQQVPGAGDRRPLHRPGEGQPRQPRLPLLQGLRQRAAGE